MTKSQYDNLVKLCKALEGGNYIQGRGYLRVDNSFCCLGVAADILDPNGWSDVNGYSNHELGSCTASGKSSYPHCGQFLNMHALASMGLTAIDQLKLSDMNDAAVSFVKIAAYIRENIMIRYDSASDQRSEP